MLLLALVVALELEFRDAGGGRAGGVLAVAAGPAVAGARPLLARRASASRPGGAVCAVGLAATDGAGRGPDWVSWAAGGGGRRTKLLVLALLGVLAIGVALRPRATLARDMVAFVTGLLLSPADVHPWYLTWMLPVLAVEPSLRQLLWACLMPPAYAALIRYRALGAWDGSTGWRWWIYLPVLGLFLGELFCASSVE